MTDNDFDLLLSETVKEFGEDYEHYNTAPHTFSPGFEKNMKYIIKTGKPRRTRLLRLTAGISAAAAVLIIGAVGFGLSRMDTQRNIISESSSAPATDNAPAADTSPETSAAVSDSTAEPDTHYNSTMPDNNASDRTYAPEQEPAFDSADGIMHEAEENNNEGIAYDEPKKELSPANSAKATDSTSSVQNAVTMTFSGKAAALTDDMADEIYGMAVAIVSDNTASLSQPVSDEEISAVRSTGFCISVSREDNSPIAIKNPDGQDGYSCKSIRLYINDTTGYAIAETEDGNISFAVSDPAGIYRRLEEMAG
jgi:hypothetical protein